MRRRGEICIRGGGGLKREQANQRVTVCDVLVCLSAEGHPVQVETDHM